MATILVDSIGAALGGIWNTTGCTYPDMTKAGADIIGEQVLNIGLLMEMVSE